MEGSGGQGPFGPGSPGYGPGGAGDDDERDAERTDTGPEAPPPPPAEDPPAPLWSAPKNAEPPPAAGRTAEPRTRGAAEPGPGWAPEPGPPRSPGSAAGPRARGPRRRGAPATAAPSRPAAGSSPPPRPPALPGQLASWGSRVGAQLLDGLIVFVALSCWSCWSSSGFAVNETAGIILAILLGLAAVAASVCYGGYFMARAGERNGQTLGKQIVGIRAVRDNGQPFGFGRRFLREFVVKGLLFGSVGSFFFSIPTLLDYLWPLWDDSDRCLHDMVVTTHVVSN